MLPVQRFCTVVFLICHTYIQGFILLRLKYKNKTTHCFPNMLSNSSVLFMMTNVQVFLFLYKDRNLKVLPLEVGLMGNLENLIACAEMANT